MKIALRALFVLSVLAAIAPAQSSEARGKQPLVFINGNGATYIGNASIGKHDETMEMARDLMKSCPEVSLTVKDSDPAPDYLLLINRTEEYGLFKNAVSQIMLLHGGDKAVLYSNRKGTVAKAVKDGCRAVLADWKKRGPSLAPAATAPPSGSDWWKSATKAQAAEVKK